MTEMMETGIEVVMEMMLMEGVEMEMVELELVMQMGVELVMQMKVKTKGMKMVVTDSGDCGIVASF